MKLLADKLSQMLRTAGVAGGLMLATTVDAHAYVDPGTGAMIIQVVGALVAGTLFYFRQIRQMISAWFARLTSRSDSKNDKV